VKPKRVPLEYSFFIFVAAPILLLATGNLFEISQLVEVGRYLSFASLAFFGLGFWANYSALAKRRKDHPARLERVEGLLDSIRRDESLELQFVGEDRLPIAVWFEYQRYYTKVGSTVEEIERDLLREKILGSKGFISTKKRADNQQ